MSFRLKNFKLKETSGVDEPANETPGWLVMKQSLKEADVDKLVKEAEELAKKHSDLVSALESSEDYLSEAPDEVKQAAVTLYRWLKSVEAPEDEEENEEEETAASKSLFARIYAGLFRETPETPRKEKETKEEEVDYEGIARELSAHVKSKLEVR